MICPPVPPGDRQKSMRPLELIHSKPICGKRDCTMWICFKNPESNYSVDKMHWSFPFDVLQSRGYQIKQEWRQPSLHTRSTSIYIPFVIYSKWLSRKVIKTNDCGKKIIGKIPKWSKLFPLSEKKVTEDINAQTYCPQIMFVDNQ